MNEAVDHAADSCSGSSPGERSRCRSERPQWVSRRAIWDGPKVESGRQERGGRRQPPRSRSSQTLLEAAAVTVIALVTEALLELSNLETELAKLSAADAIMVSAA